MIKNTRLSKLFSRFTVPFAVIGIFVGVFLMSISGGYEFARLRVLALDKELVQKYEQQEKAAPTHRFPRPIHLHIDKLVDISVENAVFEDGAWTISSRVASYLMQSARPGEKGNVIIYGHNKKQILGKLSGIKEGDVIKVMTEMGKEHSYKVTETHEVTPSQTYFLEPTQEEVLTLYTCTGLLDRYRFVVRAVPM